MTSYDLALVLTALIIFQGLALDRWYRPDPPLWHFWNPRTGYVGGIIVASVAHLISTYAWRFL